MPNQAADADKIIYGMYGTVCQQKEMIDVLAASVTAIVATLQERVEGFDAAYKLKSQAALLTPLARALDAQTKAMNEALALMKAAL